MPFEFKKLLNHGTTNPIVARLSLGALKLLEKCTSPKELKDNIGELYVNSLVKKLLRCWEIKERFHEEFKAAIESYKPAPAGRAVAVPQIARLEEECHNFLYEAKNYIRDLLQVINLIHGTDFKEASEFTRAKKGGLSLIDFAKKTFGEQDAKTRFLEEASAFVEHMVSFRNAVEHPDGYNGHLRIENFTRDPDGKLAEPSWYQEKDGKVLRPTSSIRSDLDAAIHNLLTLGEDVLVSWVAENLNPAMQIAMIPEPQRDPKCPIKYVVTLSTKLQEQLAKASGNKDSTAGEGGTQSD